jgi:ABC-type uncharacterized transport system permease subunit
MMEWVSEWVSIASATLRVSTPLIFCAMAGLLAERSGVVDISLEGKLLASAFASAAAASSHASIGLGLATGVGVSVAMALLHGWACIHLRGNQVVSGVALNIMAAGLTVLLANAWFGQGGRTPELPDDLRFLPIELPGLASPLFRHSPLTWIALLSVAAVAFLVGATRWGLRLRAVGEKPQVIDTAGISVPMLRYGALALAGLLCGLAGAYLSMAQNASFSRDMSAGMGFMALAAVVFGKWRPGLTLVACLLFGLLDASAMRLQGVAMPGLGTVPVQLIQALPYALTVLLLAGWVGQAAAPRALGIPYVKER